MTSFLTSASSSFIAALVVLGSTAGSGYAGEYGGTTRFIEAGSRCAALGPDFAAVEGSDACVRIGGHVRVQLGTNAALNPTAGWRAGAASAATLRSDQTGLGRTGSPSHLRIQGGLEYPDPFR